MEIIKDNTNQKEIVLLLKKNLVNDTVLIVVEYIRDLVICQILKRSLVTWLNIKSKLFYVDENSDKPVLGLSGNLNKITGCDLFDISNNNFLHRIKGTLFIDFIIFFLKCNKRNIILNFEKPYDCEYNYLHIKRPDLIKNLMRDDYYPQKDVQMYSLIKNTDLIKKIKSKHGYRFFLRELMCREEKQTTLIMLNNNKLLDSLETLKIYLESKNFYWTNRQ